MKKLRIVSKKDGFRRCGVKHSTDPKDYALDRFSAEQLAALKAEPLLYVHEVEVDDAPAAGEDAKAGGKGKKNT